METLFAVASPVKLCDLWSAYPVPVRKPPSTFVGTLPEAMASGGDMARAHSTMPETHPHPAASRLRTATPTTLNRFATDIFHPPPADQQDAANPLPFLGAVIFSLRNAHKAFDVHDQFRLDGIGCVPIHSVSTRDSVFPTCSTAHLRMTYKLEIFPVRHCRAGCSDQGCACATAIRICARRGKGVCFRKSVVRSVKPVSRTEAASKRSSARKGCMNR